MFMVEDIEGRLIRLISMDRLHRPISSMSGKLKRRQAPLAKELEIEKRFRGERVYARVVNENTMKARGMKAGIDKFKEKYPRQGKILQGYIEQEGKVPETNLYFGMNEGRRLSWQDYMGVMMDLGFTQGTAQRLYPELMDVSRNMARKRDETERSILIS